MILAGGRAYTLPSGFHQIEVLSGGAWLSLGLDNVVARRNQVVRLHPDRQSVVVTPMGKERLEFVISV